MSNTASLAELMKEAARLRDEGHSIVTFSPKVNAFRSKVFPPDHQLSEARLCGTDPPLWRPLLAAQQAHDAGHIVNGHMHHAQSDVWLATLLLPAQVFLPLTRLCRNECGYCTFATPPAAGRRAYMTLEEILSIARAGAAQGCTEALFTLGDAHETRNTAEVSQRQTPQVSA